MRPLNSRGRTAHRRRKAKIGERYRQPLGDISKLQVQTEQKVKSAKPKPSDYNEISILRKELAVIHAKATLIRNILSVTNKLNCELNVRVTTCLKNEAAKLLCKARATERFLEKVTKARLKATILQNDHEITGLKDEVASIKAKCKTLTSDLVHAKWEKCGLMRLLRNHEEEISQLKDTMLDKDHEATALKEEVATVRGKYETLASDHANVKREHEHDLAILKSRINQKAEELNDSIAQITQFKVQFSTLTEEKDQLAMKLDDEDQCKECVVCKESRKGYAFLPCGHMCVCEGCAASIQGQDRKCPLCRGVSTSIMKIFH
jgi:chromosome segregation ATPase